MAIGHLLSILIALPLAGAVLLLLVRNREHERDRLIHWMALGISLIEFAGTLALWAGFNPASATVAVRVSSEPSSGVSGSPVLSTSVIAIFGHASFARSR